MNGDRLAGDGRDVDITLHQFLALRDDCVPVADVAALLAGGHPGAILASAPAPPLACRPPLWLGHAEAERRFFFAGKAQGDFDLRYTFPPAYLASLPDARLAGPGYVVVAGDGRVVADAYSGDHILQLGGRFQKRMLQVELDGRRQSIPFVLQLRTGARRSIRGRCLLAAHYWHFNYHHWLVECLPRLRHAVESPSLADCTVVVPADMAPFQRESLARLGLADERLLGFDGGDLQFETLLFPSIGGFAPAEIAWLRERLAGIAPGADVGSAPPTAHSSSPTTDSPTPTAHSPSPTRLYISRADAAGRRVVNEAEVVAALAPFGFKSLTLTGMPLGEQVERFARAEIVVGPHGSGLTNMLFAPRGVTIIELMPGDHVNHCFWLMANILGQRYTFATGPVVSPARDFLISTERLTAIVGQCLDGSARAVEP